MSTLYNNFNTNSLFNDGIFIVHALKGYEFHEARIKKIFSKMRLGFEFVTDGDPSLFNKDILEKYFVKDIDKILSRGILSCTLNHIFAYEKIVSRNLEYAIIFENDPYFIGNFTSKMQRLIPEITNLPKGYIISLENSTLKFPSYWQTEKNKLLYRAKAGRMAGAYLIDHHGAKSILNDLISNKCENVIDWWHNSLINRNVIKMYWAHPPLVEQGSHNGCLNSTISSKPGTVTRKMSWLIQKYYKYYFKRIFKEKNVFEQI